MSPAPTTLTPDARRMLDDSIAVLAGLLGAGDDVGRCYSIVSAGSDVARIELAINFRPAGLNAYAALLKGPAVARDDEPWPTTIAASNPTDD